jgi:hypothetical protein
VQRQADALEGTMQSGDAQSRRPHSHAAPTRAVVERYPKHVHHLF